MPDAPRPPAAPPVALLFDFDGVIVDSAGLKTDAYAQVYAGEDPALRAPMLAYQRRHGGLGRREKFAYFERHLFGRDAGPERIEELAGAYRDVVFEAVLACPFIAGALDFLRFAHGRVDMHLVSGTPHDELVDIVERRGLHPFFASVHGAPASKRDAFAGILAAGGHAPANTLAIGDALTEYEAATSLGIPFLAVVAGGLANPFPPAVPFIADLQPLKATLGFR